MPINFEYEEISKFLSDRFIRYIKVDVENYSEYWHFHPEIEITYVERGAGLRIVGDHIAPFANGDLVLLGKNLPHCYKVTDARYIAMHQSHALQFPIQLLSSIPDLKVLHAFIESAKIGYHFTQPSPSLVHQIIHFQTLPKHERFISLLQILTQLYKDKNRVPISNSAYADMKQLSQKSDRINIVLNLIYHSAYNELNLETCASKMNMSKTYFCRWFKKMTGHTFTTYRDKVLIERFCQELITSDDNISNLAFDMGFESIFHFNRTFKKVKGISPTQYKRDFQSNLDR